MRLIIITFGPNAKGQGGGGSPLLSLLSTTKTFGAYVLCIMYILAQTNSTIKGHIQVFIFWSYGLLRLAKAGGQFKSKNVTCKRNYRQTDLAVTHATLTQLTVPHLETKEDPNFVNTSCTKKVVPSEGKLYRIV